MIKKIFFSIVNFIKFCVTNVKRLPSMISEWLNRTKHDFSSLHRSLKNIVTTNLNLGIYHMYKSNYNDAILRFKMINLLLEPANKAAYYWLGWTYFLKNERKKAIDSLTEAEDEDQVSLLNFIESIDDITHVPTQIRDMHRNITAEIFSTNFINDKMSLPKELISTLSNNMGDLPEKYKILDLGSNIGLLGYEIEKRMPVTQEVAAVEMSEDMIKLQDIYFPQHNFYNSTLCLPVDDFLEQNKQKYDVICSLNGLTFNADLQNTFDKVYYHLQENGYFAFSVRQSKEYSFFNQTMEFAYDHDQLKAKLEQSGFIILSDSKFTLEIKNNYSIFVSQKLNNKD
ncbi:MAG: methyltransferase domain-containing protein [Rickettsiaceae bacterium]|nr:methyltransferase domain-containing protein [Rickettsiaceae bacterium]